MLSEVALLLHDSSWVSYPSPSESQLYLSALGAADGECEGIERSEELRVLSIRPPAAAFRGGGHPVREPCLCISVTTVQRQAVGGELPGGRRSRDVGMTHCFTDTHNAEPVGPWERGRRMLSLHCFVLK